MTDLRPYRGCSDISVVLAIAQGRSPANLQNISAPDFLPVVLERCWRLSGETRPSMVWCIEVLSRRTTALFEAYCENGDSDIPPDYWIEGEGWNLIHNPESNLRYVCECTPIFADKDALYVILYYSDFIS